MKTAKSSSGWNIFAYALVLLAVSVVALPVMAQETTSGIRGKVVDVEGQPITSRQVTVVDTRTGVVRAFTTNNNGTFLASRLPVGGPYTVTVQGAEPIAVNSIALGDFYALTITLQAVEEVVVTGSSAEIVDVAAGPSATFSNYDLETDVAFNRDIVEVYGLDPRLNIDADDRNFQVNCAGKHPRFNSVTLDGVSQNDRFGLNTNGYSTATGMPFPFDATQQISVELAPFDVTYGGFSACNINVVTKAGSNEWSGKAFFEYTNENLRGDEVGDVAGKLTSPDYDDRKRGFNFGGPLIKDKLFIAGAYEAGENPRFIGMGFVGSGIGTERSWLTQDVYNRVLNIAQSVYDYDPGGQPPNGAAEEEKYLVRLDWNINSKHNLAGIYNFYDGFEDRASDGDANEFEFSNHFYVKGAESETATAILQSNWTDAFSTELFYSENTMDDSQVTVGPKDFADFQISHVVDGFPICEPFGCTIYLGADDSRQANSLNTESSFFKVKGQWLYNDHVMTFGYEAEELTIFNIFVQHSRGGEYDFFDDSGDNDPSCAALTAQQRFDGVNGCEPSGIDRFELGRPSRIYYGSGGGTNNPNDAAARFTNTLNSLYFQDEMLFPNHNLTVVAGLRYDWFDSSDRPVFNQAFTDATNGLRNDANIDGLDLWMPRFGFTWEPNEDWQVRGGIGRYSGGNPNVWISNAWSNDGITNVQVRENNFGGGFTVLPGMADSIELSGAGRPGYNVPQTLVDDVAGTTAADGSDSNLVLLDPNYKQPSEWKTALGATTRLPWWDVQVDLDYLYTRSVDSALYRDVSQEVVGMTANGIPIYDYFGDGEDNLMLTNSSRDADSNIFSVVLRKDFEWGGDLTLGYAYTDGEDVSPMTSFVASSNYTNQALIDINDPLPATSNYVVPHRFTLRAGLDRNFFRDFGTRITLRGVSQQGQPQSFVMSSADLEGSNPNFGRHLLYIPERGGDSAVSFGPDFDQAAFWSFVDGENLGPGFVARNKRHAKWTTRFDLRVDQEIPTFIPGTRGRAFFKLYNLGNFLNKNWGKVNDAFFFSQQVVDADLNPDGTWTYQEFNGGTVNDLLEERSLWSARVGLSIEF